MFEVTILGSGDAKQVPVWGCHCQACQRAVLDSRFRRGPCSLEIRTDQGVTLIDAGRTDLAERYAFEDIQRILLTHFHMDHVQGLFHLRWSERSEKIPVFRPDDAKGADDLYKHPGVFQFQTPFVEFEKVQFGDFALTPLPLNHSRLTLGYLIEQGNDSIAYLTDTVGLPDRTLEFLKAHQPDKIILDCSEPPATTTPRNHNDINMALSINDILQPKTLVLTHIGHHLDCWLMQHSDALPNNVIIAVDNMRVN